MKTVTIYTRAFCPFCIRAVSLLKKKNIKLNQINAGMNAELRRDMIRRSGGGTTYPQIFVEDTHIGGCDEMLTLERAGKLDPMLAS